jgi:MoaA/NifB/PqqE/SkfB family radical SAM enzyme
VEPKPPASQVEIQLGHMCNNRCVFCVSGQETALGRARPLDTSPLLAEIGKARAAGHRKITLLGGEPTLQPGFLDVVRHAVALGFEEIVIFTNGVKTAREGFIDEILATGGRFTFRLSLQGATRASHERTTQKEGSFDRLVRTMEILRRKGQRVTVNMCVVESNFASVSAFPGLLLPFGVEQLHLDMIRPLDAGARSEEELRAMIPRYAEMVPALTEMARGFPEGFDLNIGNLPYCIAPRLARFIHHDGEHTMTIAVDSQSTLSRPWDKYLMKRRDKVKPAACAACLFEPRCSGIFEAYRVFHGTEEIVPITGERLREIDPERRFLALHLRPLLSAIAGWTPPAPYSAVTVTERGDAEATIALTGAQRLSVKLGPPGAGAGSFERFALHVLEAGGDPLAALAALRALWIELGKGGDRVIHPVGDDALAPVSRSVAVRLARLRERAPFGALSFHDVRVGEGGRRAEIALLGPAGERATLWLAEGGGRPTGGYRVDSGEATPLLIEGLRAVMAALQPKLPVAPSARA